jgi:hypothetical protein
VLAQQEFLMAKIGVTCPDCTAKTPVHAQAVLATVDLGKFHEPLGRLSWSCLSCSHLVSTEVDVENLLCLLAVGVPLLDDDFGGGTVAEEHTDSRAPKQPHPEHPGTGAPFTLEDILTLHELLETEASVQQLAERPDGRS